ncbi:MAG: biotin--[acetyl-CoA-carboxylase] ligase [Gammaproteobacteria bacterium]|nr:biotin--[acetyl-CoA-carboxylase] ligase [Gammaproteobacteria bacterium]
MLDWLKISQQLTLEQRSLIKRFNIADVLASTNDWALAQFGASGSVPAVCFAEQQSAGRGRNGKNWYSPRGDNIYMSLAWSFDLPTYQLNGLGLAMGVVLAQCLRSMGIDARLKWPNDVWVNSSKIAGILVETRIKNKNHINTVIGVGLNFDMHGVQQAEIDQDWTDVRKELKAEVSLTRNRMAGLLLGGLIDGCRHYQQSGFASFRDVWLSLDICKSAELEIITDQGKVHGKGSGIDEAGGLKVLIDGQQQIFYVADVSVRIKT